MELRIKMILIRYLGCVDATDPSTQRPIAVDAATTPTTPTASRRATSSASTSTQRQRRTTIALVPSQKTGKGYSPVTTVPPGEPMVAKATTPILVSTLATVVVSFGPYVSPAIRCTAMDG